MNYQKIVDDLRRRHIRGGYGWPGKGVGTPAVSLYPNIAAELAASGRWLNIFAEFADVSQEIMAAVIEGGEELTSVEKNCLSRRWEGRGPRHLCSHVLQIVDPSTNKGKRKRQELLDLLSQAKGLKIKWWVTVKQVKDALSSGEPVTYAAYWWACFEVMDTIKAATHTPIRVQRRTAQ